MKKTQRNRRQAVFGFIVGALGVFLGSCVVDEKLERLSEHGAPLKLPVSTGLFATTQDQKLLASDGTVNDQFGSALSMEGNTMLVGAKRHNSSNGAVYVFGRNGTVWTQQGKFTANGGEFGNAVVFSGNTALVGAWKEDSGRGAVYVFTRNGSTWSPMPTKLTASDGMPDDNFGNSVALSGDTAVIGAWNNTGKGAAYVFTRSNGNWTQEVKLSLGSNGVTNDQFGNSVAISGNTAVVGAWQRNSNEGAAYIFEKKTTNGWPAATAPTSTLVVSGANGRFGAAIAIASETVLVSAFRANTEDGAVYIFDKGGTDWPSMPTVSHPLNGTSAEHFGSFVTISGDMALVGAHYGYVAPNNAQGAAYLFKRTNGLWNQVARLTANANDGAAFDEFGISGALVDDTAVVGSWLDDDKGTNSGSVYVFRAGALGFACTAPTDCVSGICADDVCCNAPCNGPCVACTSDLKGQGQNGFCDSIVAGGSRPDNLCTNYTQVSMMECLGDGKCDGMGNCRLTPAGTACDGVSMCDPMTNKVIGYACNGGMCVDNMAGVDCAPYRCSGTACPLECADDGQCIDGYSCVDKKCTQGRPLGYQCDFDTQCKSGFCVDKVCCNEPCDADCRVCTKKLQGNVGKDGYCGNAGLGSDPHDDCPEMLSTSCGTDGTCGLGAVCRLYSYGIACGDAECIGNASYTSICTGFGDCIPDPTPIQCNEWACQMGGCTEGCKNDEDCASDAYCIPMAGGAGGSGGGSVASGTCVYKKKLGDKTCTENRECLSGICVINEKENICCDSLCDGICQACSQATGSTSADGHCGNVAQGTTHDTCANNGNPCGYDGTCNEFGSCNFVDEKTSCPRKICLGGFTYEAAHCNGFGACINDFSDGEVCPGYLLCDGDTCKTTCTSDEDCVASYKCRGGACANSCHSKDDCAEGYACNNDPGQCVPYDPNLPPVAESSCDCQVPGRSAPVPGLSAAMVVMIALGLRRNDRRRNRGIATI